MDDSAERGARAYITSCPIFGAIFITL